MVSLIGAFLDFATKLFLNCIFNLLICIQFFSDPQAARGRVPSKRGVGVMFGPDVTQNFLDTNGLSLVR